MAASMRSISAMSIPIPTIKEFSSVRARVRLRATCLGDYTRNCQCRSSWPALVGRNNENCCHEKNGTEKNFAEGREADARAHGNNVENPPLRKFARSPGWTILEAGLARSWFQHESWWREPVGIKRE